MPSYGSHSTAAASSQRGAALHGQCRPFLVHGLAIGRFALEGIAIVVDGVRVVGCFLGTDAAGNTSEFSGPVAVIV
jgi:hypothetical protein